MTTWNEFTSEAPEFAAKIKTTFDAHKHKVMATLRSDGAPRISGTELDFADGQLWIGSMPDAMKARDLQRDPRYAIHSAPIDVKMQVPDVKIAGRAMELTDEAEKAAWSAARPDGVPEGPFHLFRLELDEVVCSSLDGDHMVIESWHTGRGLTTVKR